MLGKKFISYMLSAGLIFSSVATAKTMDVFKDAKSVILMDAETGDILVHKDMEQMLPPSSMSKLMTVYMAFEAIKNGKITLDQKITVSKTAGEKAKEMIKGGGSTMYLTEGSVVSVEDLLKGIIIASANEACIVLAEVVAESEENFVKQSNVLAKKLGMNNTSLVNSSGWPDDGHLMSVYDLAILSKHIINDYPEMYKMFKEKSFSIEDVKGEFFNTNKLLWLDKDADGLKTGHSKVGDYGLVGSKVKGNRRMIAVVNGLKLNGTYSQKNIKRAKFIQFVLNVGFDDFRTYQFFAEGQSIVEIPVWYGKKSVAKAGVQGGLKMTLPKTTAYEKISFKTEYKNPIEAGIKKGDVVGYIDAYIGEKKHKSYELIALEDVKRANIFKKAAINIKLILGKFF